MIKMDKIYEGVYRFSVEELEQLRNAVEAELMFRTTEGVDE